MFVFVIWFYLSFDCGFNCYLFGFGWFVFGFGWFDEFALLLGWVYGVVGLSGCLFG